MRPRILAPIGLSLSLLAASLAPLNAAVVAFGSNGQGQSVIPAGLGAAIAVSAGRDFSVALLGDGAVAAWGYAGDGRTSVPDGLSGVSAIDAGAYHTLCLLNDGSVTGFGSNPSGVLSIPAVDNAIAIAAGDFHSLALLGNGSVIGWGFPGDGRLLVPSGLAGVIAIDAGRDHSLALQSDGTVVAWGKNDKGQCNVPAGLSGVVAIAAGGYHNLALKEDGSVVAWGDNDSEQCSVPGGLSGVSAIAAGEYHSLALGSSGVSAWGDNSAGQLGVASVGNATAISGGGIHSLAVTSSGPAIAAQPQGQTVIPSSTVTFSVVASGSGLAYQWLVNGVAIEGANGDTLVIEGAGTEHAGAYSVVVSNASGSTHSQSALLAIRSLQRIASPEIVNGNTLRLRFGDSLGGSVAYSTVARFTAQVSTDLLTWADLDLPLTWIDGSVQLETPFNSDAPAQFYRVVER